MLSVVKPAGASVATAPGQIEGNAGTAAWRCSSQAGVCAPEDKLWPPNSSCDPSDRQILVTPPPSGGQPSSSLITGPAANADALWFPCESEEFGGFPSLQLQAFWAGVGSWQWQPPRLKEGDLQPLYLWREFGCVLSRLRGSK